MTFIRHIAFQPLLAFYLQSPCAWRSSKQKCICFVLQQIETHALLHACMHVCSQRVQSSRKASQ